MKQKGFIAFTSILVITVVVLAIAVSTSILGIQEANTSLGAKKGIETLTIAESCAEEALLRLRDDAGYTGTVLPLPVGNGSCTIEVTGVGQNFIATSSATIAGPPAYKKKLQVTIKKGGDSVTVSDWRERD